MMARRKKNGEYLMPERDKRMRELTISNVAVVNKGTSINLLCTMITSLIGAQNPHVPCCVHSGFSGSVCLVLKALATIYRGAHK